MAEEKQTFTAKMTITSTVDGKSVKKIQNVELDPSFKGFKFYEQESGEPCLQVSVVQEGDESKRYLTFKKEDPKYARLIELLPEGGYLDHNGTISVPLESVSLDAKENLTIDVKTEKGNKTFLLGATGIKTGDNEIVCKYETVHDIHLGGDFLTYLSSTKKDGLTMHPQIVKLLQQCTKAGVEGLLNPDGTPFMDFQIVRIKSKGETYRKSELTGEKTVRASDFFLLKLKDAEGNLNFYISVGDRMVPLTGKFAPVIHCRENYGQAGKEIYDVGFNVTRVGMDPEAYGLNINQVKQILELLEVATPEAINKCNTMNDFISNLKGKTGGMDVKNFSEIFKGGISAGQMKPIGGVHNLKADDIMQEKVDIHQGGPRDEDLGGDNSRGDNSGEDDSSISDIINGNEQGNNQGENSVTGNGDGSNNPPQETQEPTETPTEQQQTGETTGSGNNTEPEETNNKKTKKKSTTTKTGLAVPLSSMIGFGLSTIGLLVGLFTGLALLAIFCGLAMTAVAGTVTTSKIFMSKDVIKKDNSKKLAKKQAKIERVKAINKEIEQIEQKEKDEIKPLIEKCEGLVAKIKEKDGQHQTRMTNLKLDINKYLDGNEKAEESVQVLNKALKGMNLKIVGEPVEKTIKITEENCRTLSDDPNVPLEIGSVKKITTTNYVVIEDIVKTETQTTAESGEVVQESQGVIPFNYDSFKEFKESEEFKKAVESLPPEIKAFVDEIELCVSNGAGIHDMEKALKKTIDEIDLKLKTIQTSLENINKLSKKKTPAVKKKVKAIDEIKTKRNSFAKASRLKALEEKKKQQEEKKKRREEKKQKDNENQQRIANEQGQKSEEVQEEEEIEVIEEIEQEVEEVKEKIDEVTEEYQQGRDGVQQAYNATKARATEMTKPKEQSSGQTQEGGKPVDQNQNNDNGRQE